MKTRNFIYVALAFMALSCAKEIAPEAVAPDQEFNIIEKSFTAGIDVTKTSMVNGFQIQWKANDGVAIVDNVAKTPVKYLAAETGAVSALNPATAGTGVAEGATEIFAAYPFREQYTLGNGDELDGCFLTQDQKPSRNGYYASTHYAMAKSDATDNMTFKNVNGFIRFTIAQELDNLVKAIYIFSNNDEEIAGAFKMKWNNGDPQFIHKANSANKPYVRAYNSSGTGLRAGDYFLGVLPVTFEKGFTVVLQMLDGTQLSKRTEKKLTVAEGQILPMKTLAKADYDTDNTNYFVLYNEDFSFELGDVEINKTNYSTYTMLYGDKSSEGEFQPANTAGLVFVSSGVTGLKSKNTGSGCGNILMVGTESKYRADVALTNHHTLKTNGTCYLWANLNVLMENANASFVRGRTGKFGTIAISNCAFFNMTRSIIDMLNGNGATTPAQADIDKIVIENSEFGFNTAEVYMFSLTATSTSDNLLTSKVGSFIFENNIVYGVEGAAVSKFRLIHGYNDTSIKYEADGTTIKSATYQAGLSLTNCTVKSNTFADANFNQIVIRVASLGGTYIFRDNLYSGALTAKTSFLTIKQVGENPALSPTSGECVYNYYYTNNSNTFSTGTPEGFKAGSPVILQHNPLSAGWKPADGKFGAYVITPVDPSKAPGKVVIGAQRADMIPVSADADTPAANYSSVDLGTF